MNWIARRAWLTLAALVLLGGCGGGSDTTGLGKYDDMISAAYSRLADAIQRKDLNELSSVVSTSYLQQGVDYKGFVATFAAFFQNYTNLQASYRISTIDYDDVGYPRFARVDFTQLLTGTNVQTGQRDTIDNASREMIWRNESGVWRQYGDQAAQAAAQSLADHGPTPGLIGGSPTARSAFPSHSRN